ncbi:unnamed protein product [Rotaria magnacalcarata]|uniref:Uncharacterized protein n=1 Tax=Rotaria magnacalcarata TaxID=392030 RepID=A0A816T004_9BILA|nr:unnamed protein product [Rotaria magnacalcarata]
MKDFSTLFHKLWDDCFSDTSIANITSIVGSKRLHSLYDYLIKNKPDHLMLTVKTQCPITTPTTTNISNGSDHQVLNDPSDEIVPMVATSWQQRQSVNKYRLGAIFSSF